MSFQVARISGLISIGVNLRQLGMQGKQLVVYLIGLIALTGMVF